MSGWFLAAYAVVWVAIIGFVLWLDWRQWAAERARDDWNRQHRPGLPLMAWRYDRDQDEWFLP